MNPLDAFNSLIVFCLWGLGLSVLALGLLILSQFFIDKYNMIGALKLLKEEAKKSEWAIEELTKILDRMKDCPQISLSVNPFEVADINNLKLLIVGNKRGEPRLFLRGTPALPLRTSEPPGARPDDAHVHQEHAASGSEG